MNKSHRKDTFAGLTPLQSGAALVEFAIVLPLLILLLFGFIEFGRMLYEQNHLTKQVGVGARYLARVPNAVAIDSDSCAARETETAWVEGVRQATRWVTKDEDEVDQDILQNIKLKFSVKEDGPPCVIQVDAKAEFVGIFMGSIVPFTNIRSITLNASVEERYIGI